MPTKKKPAAAKKKPMQKSTQTSTQKPAKKPTSTTKPRKAAKATSAHASAKPTLRDAQRALTRERILQAATERFARVGYGATTVDDLVAEAGIGRATFYLHFSSIQDVMQALLEAVLPEVDRQYDALVAMTEVDLPSISAWLQGFFRFYAEHPGVLRASMQAETVDNRWSARLEAVSWRFVQRFSTSNEPLQQVRALILLEELDRIAYLVEVRGWKVDRTAAIAVLATHWLEFLRR